MKDYRKKVVSAVLAAAIAFSSVGITAYAEGLAEGESGEVSVNGGVAINAANFPDEIFRGYVSDNFDSNGDGSLSESEIKSVTEIVVEWQYISDLKGIEFFTSLTYLRCGYNQLTSLDLSKNTALEYLACSDNQLTSLDFSKNTALEYLDCDDNQLTSLNVSKNTALTDLSCHGNQLSSLDLSKNTLLKSLNCDDNQLTSLDVSKNTALTELYCRRNQFTNLDVSKNTALEYLACGNDQLTSLDISKNTVLKNLMCTNTPLTSLDVSNNTALINLDCRNNQLTSLDLSNNTALIGLNCDNNQLTSLDVSKNTALKELSCWVNQLTSLDVSKNTALEYLVCNNNQLRSLDLSNNTALIDLGCGNNQLTSLDVSNNTSLGSLFCSGNQLTSLDLSNNRKINEYTYSGSDNVYKLSSLSLDEIKQYGFNPSKASNWTGASYNASTNSLVNVTSEIVTYDYDLGNGLTETFTLEVTIPKVPGKPTYVQATAGDKQIKLTWKSSENAASYTIYKYENGKYTKITSTTGISYTVTGLTNGTEYKFLVRAFNENGGSAFTTADLVSATPKAAVTAVPAKPTNVKATAGDKQVTLTWTATEGAASYTIYRCDSGKYTKINSTTKTTYTVTGLTNGTTYKFLVRAFNSAGGSTFSTADLVSATPKAAVTTAPAKPTVSANVQDKVVTFSWNAVSGATYYKLYNYSNGNYGLIATVTDTSYRLRYLKNGTTYQVLVRAFNDKGGSKFSIADLITVTPKAAAAVPSKATVSATVSNGNINLTWAHVPTAFSYTIYKYENGKYTKLGATCDNFFTVKGLKAGKAYNILVRAFNSKGGNKFALSDLVSVTI